MSLVEESRIAKLLMQTWRLPLVISMIRKSNCDHDIHHYKDEQSLGLMPFPYDKVITERKAVCKLILIERFLIVIPSFSLNKWMTALFRMLGGSFGLALNSSCHPTRISNLWRVVELVLQTIPLLSTLGSLIANKQTAERTEMNFSFCLRSKP
jgi:hypothetical protein